MYEERTLNEVIRTLMHVERHTGLKISYDKTCIYHIGSLKNREAKLYTIKPLQWSDGDIDMLGISIKNAPEQSNSSLNDTIDKLENVSNTWYYRNLTLIGKVAIVKHSHVFPLYI